VKREVEYALERKVPIIPLLKNFRAENLDDWWQTRLGHLHMLTAFSLTQARRESILRAVKAHLQQTCRVVALFNQKGGVGKTTLASQLAARLNLKHRKKVLLIDLDPQQNLTELCLTTSELDDRINAFRTICGLFEPAIVGRPMDAENEFGVFVGRATSVNLDGIIMRLNNTGKHPEFDIVAGDHRSIKYVRLGDNQALLDNFALAIEEARRRYDLVIFDCNPSVSFFTRAMMENSDYLLLPLRPDGFARRGVAFTQSVIEKFYELDRRPQVNAIFNLVTPERMRPQYEQQTMDDLRTGEFAGTKWLANGYIHNTIRESGNLRFKDNTTLLSRGPLDVASVIVGRVRPGEADNNLDEVANEYARKIYG
jgi:chromosome partitioning protein